MGILKEGITLNALLYYCAKMFSGNTALIHNKVSVNYTQFYTRSLNLAKSFVSIHKIAPSNRVALIVRNSTEAVIALFALSRTGAHIYLVNPEMSQQQFLNLQTKQQFDVVIYENEVLTQRFKNPPLVKTVLLEENIKKELVNTKIKRRKAGNIIVLTGGTTGGFTSVSRKQSIFNFLNPLVVLIDEMQLYKFKKVYIPTPIYHGYGLASLVTSVLLGSEIYLARDFNTKESVCLIKSNTIEVVTLVPIMLIRMLSENPRALDSLKRILSGGAALNTGIINTTIKELNAKLYNLYGTTEAGFCILGLPEDIREYPTALGKAIKGVKIRVKGNKDVGLLEVKSSWTMRSKESKWINTGDLVSINESNIVFLRGRSDAMIVSGGENVYPEDLENVLSTHHKIKAVAVIAVSDVHFGKRLKAFVSLNINEEITETVLKEWLKDKIARYQMPISIEFLEELPVTGIGKVNKVLLE